MIMKKNLVTLSVIFLCLFFGACGGGNKEKEKVTAASVAQKWCELNGKVSKAADDNQKEAAKNALKKWENDMEAKYKGDEAFLKEVEKEAEKCEAASEGR
jgi:hypothetical protein